MAALSPAPPPSPVSALRWPAAAVLGERDAPGRVCLTVWPTRQLQGPVRWFDEMYTWAEGFAPSPRQLARMQLFVLERALLALAREEAEHIGVTLSYATVDQYDERIDALLQAHALVAHRLVVLLRGSIEAFRSHYRIRAFVDYLRAQNIPVGLRVTTPRLAMDLNAFNIIQPDFAKILVPERPSAGAWESLAMEARFAGISEHWLIASGLQTEAQVERATRAGIGFAQGAAVRPARSPGAEDAALPGGAPVRRGHLQAV